jgi:predicted NodU family carbamoyl transferase
LGFTPVAEEHLLQDLSLSGDPGRYYQDVKDYFNGVVSLKYNLHKGVRNWPYEIKNNQDRQDIAAAVQQVFEEQIALVMKLAQLLVPTKNLVYMGGCAMNSQANQQLPGQWNKIWSLPNPGDASSSVGSVLYHTKQRVVNYNFGVAKHLAISV